MEISETTKSIFYTCRLFGMAPYTTIKDSKGKICDFKRNILWCVYSGTLFLVVVLLIVKGIQFDSASEKPVRRNLYRMKSPTSKVVTTLDIFVVVLAGFFGTLCGLFNLKNTQKLNRRLKEADATLTTYTNTKKDGRKCLLMLIALLISLTIIISLDIASWIRTANRLKINTDNVKGYLPFYFSYYVLFLIQINFAVTCLGLGRRYRRLNIALRNNFLLSDLKSIGGTSLSKISSDNEKVTAAKDVGHAVDSLGLKVSPKHKFKSAAALVVATTKSSTLIDHLAYTHENLAKAMENVTNAFGPTMLALLASCLLHLVATTYFLLVELVGDKDSIVTYLQILWLTVHSFRLILVVEPCHIAYFEARKTTSIVCEILRTTKDKTTLKSLKKFWQQLLIEQTTFSPCGMCVVNRQILTSYCGAIVTYIIILMQFQKTDG